MQTRANCLNSLFHFTINNFEYNYSVVLCKLNTYNDVAEQKASKLTTIYL